MSEPGGGGGGTPFTITEIIEQDVVAQNLKILATYELLVYAQHLSTTSVKASVRNTTVSLLNIFQVLFLNLFTNVDAICMPVLRSLQPVCLELKRFSNKYPELFFKVTLQYSCLWQFQLTLNKLQTFGKCIF